MGSVRHWCCVCCDIYEPKRINKNIKNSKQKKVVTMDDSFEKTKSEIVWRIIIWIK